MINQLVAYIFINITNKNALFALVMQLVPFLKNVSIGTILSKLVSITQEFSFYIRIRLFRFPSQLLSSLQFLYLFLFLSFVNSQFFPLLMKSSLARAFYAHMNIHSVDFQLKDC